MNLEDLQTEVDALLGADVTFASIPRVLDDGTYPLLQSIHDPLRDYGMVLIIFRTENVGLVDTALEGTFSYLASVHVIIEENVSVNRAIPGRPTTEKVTRLLGDLLSGALEESSPGSGLLPMDPWFKNFGNIDGIQRCVVSFTKQLANQ